MKFSICLLLLVSISFFCFPSSQLEGFDTQFTICNEMSCEKEVTIVIKQARLGEDKQLREMKLKPGEKKTVTLQVEESSITANRLLFSAKFEYPDDMCSVGACAIEIDPQKTTNIVKLLPCWHWRSEEIYCSDFYAASYFRMVTPNDDTLDDGLDFYVTLANMTGEDLRISLVDILSKWGGENRYWYDRSLKKTTESFLQEITLVPGQEEVVVVRLAPLSKDPDKIYRYLGVTLKIGQNYCQYQDIPLELSQLQGVMLEFLPGGRTDYVYNERFDIGFDPRRPANSFIKIKTSSNVYPENLPEKPKIPHIWKLNTSNSEKFEEFKLLFIQRGVELEASHIDLKEINAVPIQVVAHKACQLAENVVVEGTFFDVENGSNAVAADGVSIRWILDHFHEYIGRKAEWMVLLAFHQGDEVYIYKGSVTGTIVLPRGEGCVRFVDSVFLPDGSTQTLAEYKPELFNARAKAVDALLRGDLCKRYPLMKNWKGPWKKSDDE